MKSPARHPSRRGDTRGIGAGTGTLCIMGNQSHAPLWIKLAGLCILGVLSFGLAAAALFVPAPTSTYQRPSAATPTATATADATTAVFIGDSYTQGVGATNDDLQWTSLVSEELGWEEINRGRGGTGYEATSGPEGCGLEYCPNYLEMLDEIEADAPDVIVVAGGQNDFSTFESDPNDATAFVRDFYTTLSEKFPDARIVAVGPSTPWGVSPAVEAMDKVIRESAESIGADYVSMITPDVLADDSLILDDLAHVGDDGHRAIADRFLSVVSA